ncbi:iron uptake system protein EfeO [Calidifontibacter indicus]|uniref:Iron uptake system component EfeO n=1 Tax=Calidifontibacter indicus TaxID=419650 RepID=A0A3D9V3I4_9MICO|nr:iron uptake system protein EfeO [Calidifontibacter indicus]REF31711.1 iron uptake system component EfeO [Calidifontibacter indicus]
MNRRLSLLLAGPVIAGTTLVGCTSNSPSGAGNGELTVTSTATECQVSANSAPSGTVVFKVKNTGNEVTEFYLLASDGLRIVGEIENITPQLTRDLVVQVPPGKYYTSCKPGMVGNGVQAAFTVTDSGKKLEATGDDKALITTATGLYASYVKDQTDKLLSGTESFVKAYKAGDFDKARALYAPTRIYWERIETVAESFGDLDPSMDAREADLEPGQKWTGWHKIEKDLWPPKTGYTALTAAERNSVADQLLKDTRTLHSRTRTQTYTVDGMGNGSKGLLDEVATGKVTGEEETWSHTDLWDFQGNVDGAKVAFENLRPILTKKDPALETSVATKFTALQKVLDKHRKGDGFKLYTELSKTEIKELSDAVNALSEPLSKVTAAVLK